MKYAHFHFGSEELLMQAYSYPKYAEQKSEHVKIIRELVEKMEEIKSDKEKLTNLLFFLIKWFVGHDSHFDKEFGDYVNERRASFERI
jgi:hemerythrin-like metal-binding protein